MGVWNWDRLPHYIAHSNRAPEMSILEAKDRCRDMSNRAGMAVQLVNNALRFGWYYVVNQIVERETKRQGRYVKYAPERPVPGQEEIFGTLRRLFVEDAEAVSAGLFPPMDEPGELLASVSRLREMFQDLPDAARRRQDRDWRSFELALADSGAATPLPDYFAQDFHFQTGGYLSEESARLYDVQVETLFYGAASAMRRAALRPISVEMQGRDQRTVRLLDIGCGTGRLLRQVRLAFPAMRLSGVDLSASYLDEARTHIGKLRPAQLIEANAEALPLEDASIDIGTCIFLFHELPPEVRRTVTREMARVLKPGGLFVFIDSLQMGDRPGWDGLIEAFPERFHEPYYRHYAIDDLAGMFADAGLRPEGTSLAFLAKVMVLRKDREAPPANGSSNPR
ncbi:MAG: hypothetical protein RLZ98_1731 [Pseudomonadota bacterium]|jgi:ubiquinone/menaquinone biosynthesis C-methylase UbiE